MHGCLAHGNEGESPWKEEDNTEAKEKEMGRARGAWPDEGLGQGCSADKKMQKKPIWQRTK